MPLKYLLKQEEMLYRGLTDGSIQVEDITEGVGEVCAGVPLAPENFGITSYQLLMACAVMGSTPMELGRLSLKEKTVAERSADLSLANGVLVVKFPILEDSECNGTVTIPIRPEQRREVMQTVKRVSRSNNYFVAIQQAEESTENAGATLPAVFPMFVNVFASDRFGEAPNNLRPVERLGDIYPESKTPDITVIKIGDDYLAEGIVSESSPVALAQSRGDFYDLTRNGDIYAFSVM